MIGLPDVSLRAGAVLPIWKVLSDTVIPDEEKKVRANDLDTAKSKDHARVVRLKLDSGEPLIGLSLMSDDVFKVTHYNSLLSRRHCCCQHGLTSQEFVHSTDPRVCSHTSYT